MSREFQLFCTGLSLMLLCGAAACNKPRARYVVTKKAEAAEPSILTDGEKPGGSAEVIPDPANKPGGGDNAGEKEDNGSGGTTADPQNKPQNKPPEPPPETDDKVPPVDPKPETKPEVPLDQVVADAKIGEEIFKLSCSGCHRKGQKGTAGSSEDDLNTTVPDKRPHRRVYPKRKGWLTPVEARHVGAYLTK